MYFLFFFKQNTAYGMRISDWSSDVCSSDLFLDPRLAADIARIDAQAGRARIGGFQSPLIVEMNVRDDRHAGGADDLLERRGGRLVGAGDAEIGRAEWRERVCPYV